MPYRKLMEYWLAITVIEAEERLAMYQVENYNKTSIEEKKRMIKSMESVIDDFGPQKEKQGIDNINDLKSFLRGEL